MVDIIVSFHLKKEGRLIYIEDRVPQKIMESCYSLLQLKPMYCEYYGYKTSELEGWSIKAEDGSEI